MAVCAYATAGIAAAFYSAISIYRHDRFASSGYDLGIFDQTIWGYSRFQIVPNTVKGVPNLLGDHFHPVLMALAPLYWLWNDARVLLVAQALLVAAASLPIFWWARTKLGVGAGLSIQTGFLAFWGVLSGVMFDFHELAVAVPAISFGIFALLERRVWLFWSMFVVGCLAKEDIALTFAAMGVYALAVQRRPQFGLSVFAAAAGWFAATVLVIIPAVSGRAYSYWNYPALGPSPFRALLALVERPYRALALLVDRSEKRATLGQLFGAWLLLPLGSPLLLIAIPVLAERFWASNPSFWSTRFQYTLPVAPVLAFATIDTVSKVRARWTSGRGCSLTPMLPAVALTCMLVLTLTVARPLDQLFTYMSAREAAATDRCLDTVPAAAPVAASSDLIPHLTHRADVEPLKRSDGDRYLAIAGSPNQADPSGMTRRYRLICHSGDATVLERGSTGRTGRIAASAIAPSD